jgi:tetratricopeptide (TPR) repeat protein
MMMGQAWISRFPDSPQGFFVAGMEYYRTGNYKQAVRYFEDGFKRKLDGASLEYVVYLSDALMKTGFPEKAVTYLEELAKIMPDYPEAYYFMGQALEIRGDRSSALKAYRKAIELVPAVPYFNSYILLALKMGDKSLANEAMGTARVRAVDREKLPVLEKAFKEYLKTYIQ